MNWKNGNKIGRMRMTAKKSYCRLRETSLKPYIDYFAKFVNNLLKEELKGTENDREKKIH